MEPFSSRPGAAFSFLLALASLTVAGCTSEKIQSTAAPPDEQFAKLDSYIETTMAEWRVPGVALAIVSKDEVRYAKGFGTLDISTGERVDPDTVFAVGSNGKSFTATMLGALDDEGALDLAEPIVSALPSFRMKDAEHTDAVTFEDALSHLSGLPTQSGLGAWYLQGADQKQLVRSIANVTPATPLGSRFAYNNSMFAVAAEAAEAATGKSYHELMASKIFTPLGMARSSTTIDRFPDANVAKPHGYSGNQPVRIPFHPVIGAAAAGSVNASLMDMTRFVRMMMNGGTLDGATVVTDQTATRIQSARHQLDADEMPEILQILAAVDHPEEVGTLGYGLGIANVEYFGAPYSFHGGAIDGMTSWMMWSAEANVGVVVLTNSGNIGYPAWASFAAINAAADLPEDTALVRLSAMRDLLIGDPSKPEPSAEVEPLLPASALAGAYDNPLGGFSISHSDDGGTVLTFTKTGYAASVTALGGNDYWADFDNPALPDFGLTISSQTRSGGIILTESVSEYPALFASAPSFVRSGR